MADWISSTVGGLVGAAAGGSFSVWVASGRLRFDRQQAAAKRVAEQRMVARPAVVALADLFTEIEGKVTPSWDQDFRGTPVGDFGEWWNDESERVVPRLRRLALEVPDAEDRSRIEIVVRGLEWSWPIHKRMSIGDQEQYLQRISRLGAEVAGAWLREQSLSDSETALLTELQQASKETLQEINEG